MKMMRRESQAPHYTHHIDVGDVTDVAIVDDDDMRQSSTSSSRFQFSLSLKFYIMKKESPGAGASGKGKVDGAERQNDARHHRKGVGRERLRVTLNSATSASVNIIVQDIWSTPFNVNL